MVTPETNTRDHIEDSLLLAYLRRQKLDDDLSLRITRHIDVERCPRCRSKLGELAQISATLDLLGRMPSYQHYPEISVADTYSRVLSAASTRTAMHAFLDQMNNRQRPRKSAMRLASLPVAIALTILVTVSMLVFANLSARPWNSRDIPGDINNSQNVSTSIARHQSTPNLVLTTPVRVDSSPTPLLTPTPATGPYLEVCSTPDNITHLRLVICGHNFKAGFNVTLIALGKSSMWFGKSPTWLLILPVDKQGNFQASWNIANCGNLPVLILAYEKTNAKPVSARLQNISFGNCPLLTPTVGPWGSIPGIYRNFLSR